MRRAALAAALVVAIGAAVVTVARGGGDQTGPLRWKGDVIAFTHPTLKTDHVVTGTVRLDAIRPLRVAARDEITVVARDGTRLPTSAVFTQTFGHGLFDPTRLPEARLPERELMRIGDVGRFEPGDQLPLTVSWREAPGGPRGARIEYPGGALTIPSSSDG